MRITITITTDKLHFKAATNYILYKFSNHVALYESPDDGTVADYFDGWTLRDGNTVGIVKITD